MKITKTSNTGINLIKEFETFKSKPYLCPANVPTIGYGTTFNRKTGKKVTLRDKPITKEEAKELLALDLAHYERGVDRYTTDAINQHQFDALVSFAYNLGLGALQRSTLLKRINRNPNDPRIAKEFRRWVNAGGRKLKGLVRRRKAEIKLYFTQ